MFIHPTKNEQYEFEKLPNGNYLRTIMAFDEEILDEKEMPEKDMVKSIIGLFLAGYEETTQIPKQDVPFMDINTG